MVAPNLGVVPHFIYASSAKALKMKMMKNNSRFGLYLRYFDISFVEKENRWIAWYYVDVQTSIEKAYKSIDKENDSAHIS